MTKGYKMKQKKTYEVIHVWIVLTKLKTNLTERAANTFL